ncbi:hypothetical protein BST61_g4431 [Cercospora zeina]
MVVPTAVSIISTSVEHGTPRNLGFAMIFLAQPLGFAIGLVLAGDPSSKVGVAERLLREVDWIGALIAGGSTGILSYVLAMLAGDADNIKHKSSLALLFISLSLLPAFVIWNSYQEKRGKPAIIPVSMWRNTSFTTMCLLILLTNAVLNSMELFSSLFFQKVQGLSAVEASVRILPQVVVAILFELLSGILVNKLPVLLLVQLSSVFCAGSPLLMAPIDPAWSYWYAAFWAQALAPVSIDVLCTAGTLIVAAAYPTETQALGGAVLGTFAQLGASIGICILSVISASVTAGSHYDDK